MFLRSSQTSMLIVPRFMLCKSKKTAKKMTRKAGMVTRRAWKWIQVKGIDSNETAGRRDTPDIILSLTRFQLRK